MADKIKKWHINRENGRYITEVADEFFSAEIGSRSGLRNLPLYEEQSLS
ncbi:MAG: hypothetical protein ACQEU4_10940 [Bacillota bacterium]